MASKFTALGHSKKALDFAVILRFPDMNYRRRGRNPRIAYAFEASFPTESFQANAALLQFQTFFPFFCRKKIHPSPFLGGGKRNSRE
ncbi:hypothetical protein PGRAT_24675 [Paenibacillus graminis]|uniref:Uncharacterized protein n=1 Tax=Paenibacillus graminis TaxID=189425 RepID=A0A089MB18_9BACL|nr:hypothetical protein PGRAT_24675 [Paenibacillus graminis]